MGKVVLITGGSSGIGKHAALALQRAGCTVYEMSRKDSIGLEGIRHIRGDVTDEAQAAAAVKEVVEYLRGISPVWRDLVSGKREFIL